MWKLLVQVKILLVVVNLKQTNKSVVFYWQHGRTDDNSNICDNIGCVVSLKNNKFNVSGPIFGYKTLEVIMMDLIYLI